MFIVYAYSFWSIWVDIVVAAVVVGELPTIVRTCTSIENVCVRLNARLRIVVVEFNLVSDRIMPQAEAGGRRACSIFLVRNALVK